ncbi:MAG: DNA polymerase ligase N-terminal domain-containing protein [Ilumatobacteraceae bacterium]
MSPVESAPGEHGRFVLHEHYASRHHFDLRLEGGGTLWSWALPKGMPTDPSKNRLAVRVDDHDLDHIDFVDPTPVAGVDGAIAKSIADCGTYTTIRSGPDKLVVDLDGRRGSRRYALIHTGGTSWILHLMTVST